MDQDDLPGRGVERASPALIDAMRGKGREIQIAGPGSEELRYLDYMGANANVGGESYTSIILRDDPRQIEVWEEFLHGTQWRCGIIRGTSDLGRAEIHVKEFMIRHATLIGIIEEDRTILNSMLAAIRHVE